MLDLDRETFIAQYVTTFLANYGAERYKLGGQWAKNVSYPVDDAIGMARQAWCSLLAADVVMPHLG